MQLIYLAPLTWSSFAQRPHMFVRWFHQHYQCPVLWVNPYPTRFPAFNDFKRITQAPDDVATTIPDWLRIVSSTCLPIEPLPGSQFLNAILWRPLLKQLHDFSQQEKTILVIGKPSALALMVLDKLSDCRSFYDAMDNYPQFYQGLSRIAFAQRERQAVEKVDAMATSSTALQQKWLTVRNDIKLVHNALTPELFFPVDIRNNKNENVVFGYVGTLAQWFDWDWLIALAQKFPSAIIRIIGPVYVSGPENLPNNIQLLPSCDHAAAIMAMRKFTIGLIPFKKNELTSSVDPIKFYEYRALGIPVVSTAFGEMLQHQAIPGTFISRSQDDIFEKVMEALSFQETEAACVEFIDNNTWAKRFDSLSPLFE